MSWWSNTSQDSTVQWRDDCLPKNITDVLEIFDGGKDYFVSEYEFTDDKISDKSDSERKLKLW